MLATNEVAIERDDTTESLTPKLADAAATLMDLHLADLLTGQITAVPQPEGATETRQLTKEDGRIDWNMPAAIIERQVRAMWNWPRAFAELPGGTRMQVHRAVISTESPANPGQISVQGTNVVVGTGEGGLLLERVQLPGGKPIEGHAIVQALQRYS
jgi:methionyl-tRNA formyltransferase